MVLNCNQLLIIILIILKYFPLIGLIIIEIVLLYLIKWIIVPICMWVVTLICLIMWKIYWERKDGFEDWCYKKVTINNY